MLRSFWSVSSLLGGMGILLSGSGLLGITLGLRGAHENFGNLTLGVVMSAFYIGYMAGAWIFVHTSVLFAMDRNGPELVIALGLLSLVLAVTGSGRFGLDHVIVRRLRRGSRTA